METKKSNFKVVALLFTLLIWGCSNDSYLDPVDSERGISDVLKTKSQFLELIPNSTVSPEIDIPELNVSQLEEYNRIRDEYKTKFQIGLMEKSEAIVELYPTGTPIDVVNIRAILDEAGEQGIDLELRLKATDEDGNPTAFYLDFVIVIGGERHGLSGKVKLIGESNNGNATRIIGGSDFGVGIVALYTFERELIQIEGITFEEGGFLSSGGGGQPLPKKININNCQFINFSPQSFFAAVQIFGTEEGFVLKDCEFDNVNLALWILNYNEALIEDNIVTNSSAGFSIGNNASGSYIVRDNSVSISTSGNWDIGILIRIVQDTNIDIYDNSIDVNDPEKIAIIAFSAPGKEGDPGPMSGINIFNNEINGNTELWGHIDISAYSLDIADVCISNNKISGVAGFAITAHSYSDKELTDIVIRENDISDFTSSCLGLDEYDNPIGCADIYLGNGTNSLEYCGDLDVIIKDDGINNTFTNENICLACQ